MHAYVRISNPSPDTRIGFKIKTTSPERVAVTPKCGILAPGEHVDAAITVGRFSIDERSTEGKNRPTEKLLLLSAISEVNRLGNDFDSPVELWGRVKPGNIAKRTLTLQLKHQDKNEEAAVNCGQESVIENVGPISLKSEMNRLNNGSVPGPEGLPKPRNIERINTLQLNYQDKAEEAAVICGDEGFTGNVGPIPGKPEKNRLNSGSGIDPEGLPKAIKLVGDLIANKRKMAHDAMVHAEDVPSGGESAEEKEPEEDSALKTWQWIGIAAVGCAAGVIGGIVAFFYFRQ